MFARGKLCATASNYDSTSRCPRFSGCSGWPALEAPWASCVAYTSAGRKGLVNNSTASVIMGADRSHARIPSTQASEHAAGSLHPMYTDRRVADSFLVFLHLLQDEHKGSKTKCHGFSENPLQRYIACVVPVCASSALSWAASKTR